MAGGRWRWLEFPGLPLMWSVHLVKVGSHGGALGGLRGSFGGQEKDNVGKALEDAVGQAV